jgi:hypothetical protein
MKANELRIGNWVYILPLHPLDVSQITKINGEYFIDGFLVDRITGIPISEYVLLKAGFKQDKITGSTFSIGDFSLLDKRNGAYYVYVQTRYAKEIKYLHELQNIYFALTNEELKMQL